MDVCYYLTLLLSRHVQVEVSEGIVEGQVVDNEYGCPYFSFKGIPYAEPPVGELRFKAPQPKTPWEGVYNATSHGNQCYSFQTSVGSEDCLYVNVYSPNIAPIDPLPVMVYIHGGGFVGGSGNEEEYGPKYLLRKDVIVVTFNYRLEILGFLSLDTEDIPGNAGMKDQVAALRWIKKNINKFGGDPDNITLFGESAGAASVSFHLVSPMSKGLFNRAITQSGTMISSLSKTFRARDRALLLARDLGCNSTDDKEIYEFLKMQPAANLVNKRIPVSYWQSAKETIFIYYSIVSEKQFGDRERFFYGDTYEVLRNGIHEGVAVISGYTQDEGILWFADNVVPDKVFDQANHFLEFFVPEPYTVNVPLETQMEIGERFRNFYLQNKTASKETLDDLLKFFSMELIIYGAISQQKIIAKKNKNKTYLYKFTCQSELNLVINFLGLQDLFDYRPVVGHADDLAYIFSNFKVDNMSPNTYKMIEQVTTLWTNFAKYGDPTPDDNLGVKWLPYTVENEDYLDIGEVLVPEAHPEKEEMEFWESNFKEFLPVYAP
ncbi:unnamed protein product [Euphydryas editha]|nr:unnamed protein product [Euphydryas editha]